VNCSKLTARELRLRYRQGERQFKGVDLSGESLRGMNLKGIDLSEADLSGTDIRGTNFTEAKLIGTQFVAAKAGIQRRWLLLQFLLITIQVLIGSVFLTGIWSNGLSVFDAYYNPPTDSLIIKRKFLETITGTIELIIGSVFLILTYLRSFTVGLSSALATIAFFFLISFFSPFIVPVSVSAGEPTTYEIISSIIDPVAVISSFALTFAGTIIVCICVAVSLTNSFAYLVSVLVAISISTTFITLFDISNNDNLDYFGIVNWYGIIILYIGVFANLTICYLIAKRAISGDSREKFIRNFSVWISSLGGTKFIRSNLNNSSFSKTVLKSAHLHQADLNRAKFHLSKKVNLSRFGKTILADYRVQNLLVTLRGHGQSYIGVNLKGAYLAGADLTDANFTEADLSHATLEGADLQRANFTKTQALGTQFRQADLTGACLESWNIDSTTQLTDAMCEHIYLLNNHQERRPNSGSFQPGEFTKLFEEVLDTIDLIFQNGIDWKAFLQTFRQVQVTHDGAELAIQSIENKGDGVVVVKLNAAPDADKEAVHQSFMQGYHTALKEAEDRYKDQLHAKEEQIQDYRAQNANMQEVVKLLAARPINVDVKAFAQSRAMQGNDESQNFNVQGDFSINAQNSVVNLRDISGKVSNQISQLSRQVSADQPNIKDLLTQLKAAIESDAELSTDDKADALAEVGELATAAQNPQESTMQKVAKGAMNGLKGIASSLSDASKLAAACKELLPLIMGIFGL
jgi:uncharacterized protein YjbI with pentapeptide repeats